MCYLIVRKRTGEVVAFTRNVDSDWRTDEQIIDMRVDTAVEADILDYDDYAYIESKITKSLIKNLPEI